MSHLRVEELEPRQLLSSANFFSRPPPLGSHAERSAFVDFDGGHTGPAGPGAGRRDTDPSRTSVPHVLEGRNVEAPSLRGSASQTPGTARGSADSVAGDADADQEPGKTNTGAVLSTPPDSISSRGRNEALVAAVVGTSSAGPTPQPLSIIEILAVVPGIRIGLQDSSSPRSPRGGRSPWEALWDLPDLFQRSPADLPRDGKQSEEAPALPPPQVSGVLPFLPPFDLTGLQLGLQQFLERLEQIGPRLPRPGPGAGPCLWIVAGAAVVAACEIARRQLKSDTEAPVVEGGPWPGSPPDPLNEG